MSDENTTSEIKKPARDEHGRLLPGGTANPKGRPPGSLSLVYYLREELAKEVKDTDEEGKEEKVVRAIRLIRKILSQAEKGDPQSLKLVMNYIEGLPKQNLDVTSGGKPIPILGNVQLNDSDEKDNQVEEAN